ncbi:MAG: helix-turn-helix domain-containing protein [Rhodospirillaceae bacterium]
MQQLQEKDDLEARPAEVRHLPFSVLTTGSKRLNTLHVLNHPLAFFGIGQAARACAHEDMAQEDVAKKMGTSQSYIAKLEGCTTRPTMKALKRYAAAKGSRLKLFLSHGHHNNILKLIILAGVPERRPPIQQTFGPYIPLDFLL